MKRYLIIKDERKFNCEQTEYLEKFVLGLPQFTYTKKNAFIFNTEEIAQKHLMYGFILLPVDVVIN